MTRSPAKVWFAKHGESVFDVVDFTVKDEMSSPFEVVLTASSADSTFDTSSFVGGGAAFRIDHLTGALVWAGLCREAMQTRAKPDGAGVALYRFVIVPPLERLKLRRNYRVFQGKKTHEIVQAIFDEWKIVSTMKEGIVADQHHAHEYRVQAGESDFDFVSRLLEEEGTAYSFAHEEKQWPPSPSRVGSEQSTVVIADRPEARDPVQGSFPYRQSGRHKTFADGENVVFDVAIRRRMTFGKATIRDFDVRLVPDAPLSESVEDPKEKGYEDFRYQPGAFRALDESPRDHTPVADDRGAYRSLEAKMKLAAARLFDTDHGERLQITFKTTALELGPGDVLSIGQGSHEHHAHAAVLPTERLLVIARHLSGTTLGVEHQVAMAVPAKRPYRPARKTPRSSIHGVQSAIVVGPKAQEIHTDELGRVRVQFHWDRENGYDEHSSCWMRVSQGWAGSGFGMVSIPRIGQEVLVAFYGGDPDQPVVVGRVYGVTNAVPHTLPKQKTKSGWRTESTRDGAKHTARGFNEIVFDDAVGHEHVALRAEQSLSVLAKGAESRDVGGSRTTHIGANDTTHVAKLSQLQVGANAGVKLTEKQILLTTRKAHVLLDEDKLSIEAQGTISLHAGKGIKISSNAGTVWIDGTPDIDINNDPAQGPAPAPTPLGPAAGPGGGPQLPAPYRPEGATTTVPGPGGFPEVKVQ